MKRTVSLLTVLCLILSLLSIPAQAVVVPNDDALFTSSTPAEAIAEIEARFHIKITDNTRNGVSMEVLHNLETSLNLLSFELFQETLDSLSQSYGATLEIIFSRYSGQSYSGLTSLTYDVRGAHCSIELVELGRQFISSGTDVSTMVHELSHLINYAMLDYRGNNPVERVFLPANDGLYYQEGYRGSWPQYVSSLGDTAAHYFVNDYAMTDVYEDFASLFELITEDSDLWEATLLLPENKPLLTKYQGSVALLKHYFTSAARSPLTDLYPASWAIGDWSAAKSLGLVPAELDRTYEAPITRLEFCRLMTAMFSVLWGQDALSRAGVLGLDLSQSPYTDCSDPEVVLLSGLNVISGRGNGIFDPNASITRQEAAVMLVRAARAVDSGALSETSSTVFADSGEIADWAADSIQSATAGQIMNGAGDNLFAPLSTYDRQQSIVTAYRLYQYLAD